METSYDVTRSLAGVLAGIDRCIALTDTPETLTRSKSNVSAWNVGEHLEHLLLADRALLIWVSGVLDAAEEGPAESETDVGRHILSQGSIPRGRGVTPAFADPSGMGPEALRSDLLDLRSTAEALVPRAAEIEAKTETRAHHALGPLSAAGWLRFLHIHHDHHDGIIADVLA